MHQNIEALDFEEAGAGYFASDPAPMDPEALEVYAAVKERLGELPRLDNEDHRRLFRYAFDCHELVASGQDGDQFDVAERIAIVDLCNARHRTQNRLQAEQGAWVDGLFKLGSVTAKSFKLFAKAPGVKSLAETADDSIELLKSLVDTSFSQAVLTRHHLRFLIGDEGPEIALSALLEYDWDLSTDASHWLTHSSLEAVLSHQAHLREDMSQLSRDGFAREEDFKGLLSLAREFHSGVLDVQEVTQALKEEVDTIKVTLEARQNQFREVMAACAQESPSLTPEARVLLAGFGIEPEAFDPRTQLSVSLFSQSITRRLEVLQKKAKLEKQAVFENNLKGVYDTGGFLSGLGQVLKCKELSIVGQCVQSVAKITEGVWRLNGALGTTVSGFAMLGPIAAIGMGVLSLISAFGGSDDGLGEALQAIMESIQHLGRMIEQLSEQVREGFELVHLNLVINRIEIQVNRTAILHLSQRVEFLSAELTRDLTQQRRLNAYRHQQIETLLRQIEDNTSPLRQQLEELFNFSRRTASPSEKFMDHFNYIVSELTEQTALTKGASHPALVGEAIDFESQNSFLPDILRMPRQNYRFHLNTLRHYAMDLVPALNNFPRPVNLGAACYIVLNLLRLIKVNQGDKVMGVLDRGKVGLLRQAMRPIEDTLAFQQALWPVAPILIEHLIEGMVKNLTEVKRLLSTEPNFSAEAFSKQVEAEINEVARQRLLEDPSYFNADSLDEFERQQIQISYAHSIKLIDIGTKADTELAYLVSRLGNKYSSLLKSRREYHRLNSGKGWVEYGTWGTHEAFIEAKRAREFLRRSGALVEKAITRLQEGEPYKTALQLIEKQKLAIRFNIEKARRRLKPNHHYHLGTGLSLGLESCIAPSVMVPNEIQACQLPILPAFHSAISIIPEELLKAQILGLASIQFSYAIERNYDEDSIIHVYGEYLLNGQHVIFFKAQASFDAMCFSIGEAAWYGWIGLNPPQKKEINIDITTYYYGHTGKSSCSLYKYAEIKGLQSRFLSVCTHEVIHDYGQAELVAAIDTQLDRYQQRFKQHLLEALETASPLSQHLNRMQAHFELLRVLMETLLPNQIQPLGRLFDHVRATGIFTVDGLKALLNEEAIDYDQILDRLISPEKLSLFEQVLHQLLDSIKEPQKDVFGAMAVNLLSEMLAIYEPGAKEGGTVQPAFEDLLLQVCQEGLGQTNQRFEVDTHAMLKRLEQIARMYKEGDLPNTSTIQLLTQGEPGLESHALPFAPKVAPSEEEILANVAEKLGIEDDCLQQNAGFVQRAALLLEILFHLQNPSKVVKPVEPSTSDSRQTNANGAFNTPSSFFSPHTPIRIEEYDQGEINRLLANNGENFLEGESSVAIIHEVSALVEIANQDELGVETLYAHLSQLSENVSNEESAIHLFPCYAGGHFFIVALRFENGEVQPFYINSVKNEYDDSVVDDVKQALHDAYSGEMAEQLILVRLDQQTEIDNACGAIVVQNCIDIARGQVALTEALSSEENHFTLQSPDPHQLYAIIEEQRQWLEELPLNRQFD